MFIYLKNEAAKGHCAVIEVELFRFRHIKIFENALKTSLSNLKELRAIQHTWKGTVYVLTQGKAQYARHETDIHFLTIRRHRVRVL